MLSKPILKTIGHSTYEKLKHFKFRFYIVAFKSDLTWS